MGEVRGGSEREGEYGGDKAVSPQKIRLAASFAKRSELLIAVW